MTIDNDNIFDIHMRNPDFFQMSNDRMLSLTSTFSQRPVKHQILEIEAMQ